MVPAPNALESSIGSAIVRQEEVRAAGATALELVLIFVAFFISLVLSLIPKRPASSRRLYDTVYSSCVIGIALCSSLGAVSLAIATLILGGLNVISLDAVAGIIFALGPAIFSIPREILSYSRDNLTASLIWGHLANGRTTNEFRYVRLIETGQLCLIESLTPSTTGASSYTTEEEVIPNWFGGDNLMVIRRISQKALSQEDTWYTLLLIVWNRLLYCTSKDRKNCDPRPGFLTEDRHPSEIPRESYTVKGVHVYGFPTLYRNFAKIEDLDGGKTLWWWNAVSSARYLIARPGRMYLESSRRVGKALALLYDIVSIGDLVLHFHSDIFEWMLQMDHDVRTAVISASAFTCNRFIQELELNGWDPIGPEDLKTLPAPKLTTEHKEDSDNTEKSTVIDYWDKTKSRHAKIPQTSLSIPSSKHYALIFLILAEKSQRFLLPTANNPSEFPCSERILDKLFEGKDKPPAEFRKLASDAITVWLRGWGLDIASVYRKRRQGCH